MGQDPETVATVGRSAVGRAETVPARIEPERGQVGEDDAEVSPSGGGKQAGDVLELFARRERPGWACWGNELGQWLDEGGVRDIKPGTVPVPGMPVPPPASPPPASTLF